MINWDNVPVYDRLAIRPVDISPLKTANKSTLTIFGMTPLYVRIRSPITPTCVAVVKKLSVLFVLDTIFHDKYI